MQKIHQKNTRIFILSILNPQHGRNSGMPCVRFWSSGLREVFGFFVSTTHIRSHLIFGNGFWMMSIKVIRMFCFSLRPSPDRRQCIAWQNSDSPRAIPTLHGGLKSRSWQNTSKKSPRLLLPTTFAQIFLRTHRTFFTKRFSVVADQCLWSGWL